MTRALAITAAVLVTGPALSGEGDGRPETERVYYDAPDEDGTLSGGFVTLVRPQIGGGAGAGGAPMVTILDNGPPENRIDLVFVGDGYVAGQMALFATHANSGLVDLLEQEPFKTYQTFFNAYRVDVVSNESGVDNDPIQGIQRDTALDMGFWCSGIERLLCINVTSAYQYAAAAPDIDQVFAVANSSKYGGAGYTGSDLATFSGANQLASEVAIHELGHSLGNLADEYSYGDGAVYTGLELLERNVSVHDVNSMQEADTKWSRWIGHPGTGFGGLVSAYQGAYYHDFGVYRPTPISKMRTLNTPFNLPSVEGLIIEFYKIVNPIDDATPTDQTLGAEDDVFVNPVEPVDHDLEVQWRLDGVTIAQEVTSLDIGALALTPGAYTLTVTVRDGTQLVRDEDSRLQFMTETRAWNLVLAQPGDVDGDFDVDLADLDLLLAAWGQHPIGPPDFDGDGTVGTADLLLLLTNWSRD